MDGRRFIIDGVPKRDYQELTYIGTLNPILRKRTLAKEVSTYNTPSITQKLEPEIWHDLNRECGDFFYNLPTASTVETAEMKIDEVRPWPTLDKFRAHGQAIADKMLEIPLTARTWTDEETLQHLDLKKGAAAPWKYYGFKNREEFFSSTLWRENYTNPDWLKQFLPLYESVGKEELSDLADFHSGKVRTFQITGSHLLYWQLRLFGQGNENLKNYKWSKYGFNPFFGGTDKWYREINVKDKDGNILYKIRICWDISGYDRKIFLLWVANRRYRCWCNANPNSPFEPIARWVRDAWIRSVLIFHNGDIVIRKRGNNSGSGTTTSNNIEAGFEVVADLLTYTYFMKYGELPSYELVIEQMIALFGDDNAMYLMDCFSFMLDEKLVKDRLYQNHGLLCKWLVGGVEHPFNELPFLGFTFSPYKDFFIPKWNIKRLLHPILYTPNRKDNGQYLQQVYSLMILSFAHYETYLKIRLLYTKLLLHFKDSGQPETKMMVSLGVPTIEEVEAFYLGFESDSKLPLEVCTGGGGPLLKFKMQSSNESKQYFLKGTKNLINEIAISKEKGTFPNKLTTEVQVDGDETLAMLKSLRVISPQLTSVQITQPTYRTNSDGTWTCYSTIFLYGLFTAPQSVLEDGPTQLDSFLNWFNAVSNIIGVNWEPDLGNHKQTTLKLWNSLRSLPTPSCDHPLYFIWEDKNPHRFMNLLKLCGDIEENPGPMGEKQYLAQNKKRFDAQKLTSKQRKVMYQQYLSRQKNSTCYYVQSCS
jgi:hypothetical protein